MSVTIPCTCQEPPVVKLLENNDDHSTDDSNCAQQQQKQQQQQLFDNLRRFGWSPIQVCVPTCPPPTHAEIAQLFTQRNNHANTNDNDAHTHAAATAQDQWIYRAAESGGSETLIEPKESLEISHQMAMNSPTDRVHNWFQTLSSIAHKVCCDVLRIPPNTLLAVLAEEEMNDKNGTTSTNQDTIMGSDCIDLMRVFYYHTIHKDSSDITNNNNNNNQQKQQQYGSSPHTDWGSWTVVWQDDVGGLETYCRACSKWVPVRAAPSVATTTSEEETSSSTTTTTTNVWNCIVHVSDMTSLALGSNHQDDKKDNTNNTLPTKSTTFPSPKHRVVCSTRSERTSLVYFAYPPSNISMKEMQERLVDWRRDERGPRLPLEEYYLLQDQSSISETSSSLSTKNTPESTYSQIAPLSIQQAIETKWHQVQRTVT